MSDQQEGKATRSVHIVNNDLLARKTIVTDAVTGERIKHIKRITIAPMGVNDMMSAEIEVIGPTVDLLCEAGFIVAREEWTDAELPPPNAGEYLVVLEQNGEAWQSICTYSVRQGMWIDRPDFATVTHYQPLPSMPYGVGLRSAHSG